VSVITVASPAANDKVTATIPVGSGPSSGPMGVAVTRDGSKVYVANFTDSTVSMIPTTGEDKYTATTIPMYPPNSEPLGVTVSSDGKAYVANYNLNSVSVIDTAAGGIIVGGLIPVGNNPYGVALTPNGSRVYVANRDNSTVSVINAGTNKVTTTLSQSKFGFNDPVASSIQRD
jgi:YVTN family beta-propeller protein